MSGRTPHARRSLTLAHGAALATLTLLAGARAARAQSVGSDSARPPAAPAMMSAASPATGGERAARVWPASAQLHVVGDSTLVYLPAGRTEFLRRVPGTLVTAGRQTFRWRNAGKAAALAAVTVGLVASDQHIFDETRRFSDRVGISPEHPSIDFKVSGAKLFYLPTSISSTMYYLGDGWTTMTVAGSFLTVGMLRDDHRAVRTASEITQSLLALGVVTQTLKHVSGRQTPSEATAPGGRWRPMPSLSDYGKNVPAYDAFPSGHLATAMATVTVVALNYPEKRWIKPVGYGLMSLLAFQMVNNGVHWASDYPLALAIGGTVGRIAVESGRTVVTGAADAQGRRVEPVLSPGRVGAQLRF